MINLLPLREKKENEQEENWKIVLVLGILVLVFLFSLSLILFSIKVYISREVAAQKILFEQKETELKTPQARQFEEKIKQSNLILAELKSFYQQAPYLTEVIERISKALPQDVYLTNLSLDSQPLERRELQCRLLGFSPSREALVEFKENLEKDNNFKNVYFPPINWVKPIDIDFSVTFQIVLEDQ